MSSTRLTDKNGKTLGHLTSTTEGKEKLTDPNGKTLGYYNSRSDRTTDPNGTTLGHGNILACLLGK
jgi:hypothetical protein